MALLSHIGANLNHMALVTEQFSEQGGVSPFTLWCFSVVEGQAEHWGSAHTHMGGLSEKSVVAEQLLALVRPPQPTHAPALLLLLLLNSATQKLHHLPLESSLPSSRREWEMQLKFDELVWEGFCRNGYEEALVGQVGGGLACLDGDGAQTGFTDRCPKHLLTTPGSMLITRDVSCNCNQCDCKTSSNSNRRNRDQTQVRQTDFCSIESQLLAVHS